MLLQTLKYSVGALLSHSIVRQSAVKVHNHDSNDTNDDASEAHSSTEPLHEINFCRQENNWNEIVL